MNLRISVLSLEQMRVSCSSLLWRGSLLCFPGGSQAKLVYVAVPRSWALFLPSLPEALGLCLGPFIGGFATLLLLLCCSKLLLCMRESFGGMFHTSPISFLPCLSPQRGLSVISCSSSNLCCDHLVNKSLGISTMFLVEVWCSHLF